MAELCAAAGLIVVIADSRRVIVVFDPDYGERLRDVWPKSPAWVVASSVNQAVMAKLRVSEDRPDLPLLTGTAPTATDPEQKFLDDLYMIDLHHGPFSTTRPYTAIEAIGVPLTTDIRAALAGYGFAEFSDQGAGFVAIRSDAEARRIRE